MKRGLWSPSRVKAALQCGRRLQGKEEGWPVVSHINGVRGGIAHTAIEKWEGSERDAVVDQHVVDAWEVELKEIAEKVSEANDFDFDPVALADTLSNLWGVEAEIRAEEDVVAEALAGQYKQPRRTKAFAQQTAHLDNVRDACANERAEIESWIDEITWPWTHEKSVLEQGFDHSLETARKGAEYLTGLYPEPDIVGAEWNLETTLDNGYRVHGYIDRVEATATGVEVVDYKSSRFQDTELDHFIQVATYAVIAEDHMGFPPARVRLAYLRNQDSDVFDFHPRWRESLASLVASADDVLARHAFAPSFAGCGICSFFKDVCQPEFALTPITQATQEVA